MTIKRGISYCFGALLALYVAAAVSPMPGILGRTNPSAASWLSPMDFNFSEKYLSGEVLQFRVGMTSGELRDTLLREYAAQGSIILNCTGTTADSLRAVTSVSENEFNGSEPYLCAYLDGHRLSAQFELANKVVVAIELFYIRNEGI